VSTETVTLATSESKFVADYVLEFQASFIDSSLSATGNYEVPLTIMQCTVTSLSVSGATFSASSDHDHINGIPTFTYEVGEVAWVLNSHTVTITQSPSCGYGEYTI